MSSISMRKLNNSLKSIKEMSYQDNHTDSDNKD